MLAHADQRVDNVLECIHIVVEHHQIHQVRSFNGFQYINLFVFLVRIVHDLKIYPKGNNLTWIQFRNFFEFDPGHFAFRRISYFAGINFTA